MHWILRVLTIIAGNALALWLANHFVSGFVVDGTWVQWLVIAVILMLLNFFLKPLLTLVLGPVILLTLGLGVILVNAIILYLLPILADRIDFLHGSIMIQNIPALLIGTLIVSIVNFVVHFIP